MFSYRHQTLLEHIANIQKRLFIIPIVLMSFLATPSWGAIADEIIGDKAIEIMTDGVMLNVEFTQEALGLPRTYLLSWRALVKFGGKIYACEVSQIVERIVETPPITSCLQSH